MSELVTGCFVAVEYEKRDRYGRIMGVEEVTTRRFVIGTISLVLSACASPFSTYYYDQTGGADITANPIVEQSTEEPQLYRGTDVEQDVQRMLENGYAMVGYSSFNAGNTDKSGALYQARKVHASVVLTYTQYTDTVSGAVPFTQPDIQTSSTYLHGGVSGSGGSATYSGNAYTTTRGTRTTYIPYSVRRSDYLATYWVKLTPPIFGTHLEDLTAEKRRELGSNRGMLVKAVVKGSPAFRADVLEGDILRKIGVVEIFDSKTFADALKIYQGELVNVVIYRNGKEIEKQIQLDSGR